MRVLVVGAGPVGFMFASLWLRWGAQTYQISRKPLESPAFELVADHPGLSDLAGRFQLHGVQADQVHWDLVVLAVPADQYDSAARLARESRCWVLPSAPLGSHRSMDGRGEVVSLSSFWGAGKAVPEHVQTVRVRGRKRRVYGASTAGASQVMSVLEEVLGLAGVELVTLQSPLEAEARNITTYVHPALFITPLALDSILRFEPSRSTWMYKLYPQGPITRTVMETMVVIWREISSVLEALGVAPINLLRFLNDDNYPVLAESVPLSALKAFPKLDGVDQAFWLYVRYASLLIDPHSERDGVYQDFSAVAFPHAKRVDGMRAEIPRIPFEDYRTLLLHAELARRLCIPCPRIQALCKVFEDHVERFERLQHVRTQCNPTVLREQAARQAAALCP